MSLSVQSCVGSDCRKMMMDCATSCDELVSCLRLMEGDERTRAVRAPTHLEVHLAQRVAPPHQERQAHVQVELGKGVAALGLRAVQKEISSSRPRPEPSRRLDEEREVDARDTCPTCARCS